MASRKDYTYQIKGNKLSLLERDQTSGTGLNYVYAGTDGDGVMDGTTSGSISLTSPIESVIEGIEIEYAYSPSYIIPPKDYSTTTHGLVGWTVVDGYLTFIGYNLNWTTTTIAANEHIYVGDSSRWSGVHKVQEVQAGTGSHGGIKTYTKVSSPAGLYVTDTSVTWNAAATNTITGLLVAGAPFSDSFGSGAEYLSISGGSSAAKTQIGLFSGWVCSGVSTTLDLSNATQYTVDDATYGTTSAALAGDTTQAIYIRQGYYDNAYVISDVDVLSDESDDIDVPPYLSKALVYYVKAKVAEDAMNIEAKEYMMREFRKMVEKHESSKIAGSRGVMTGPHSIR